MAVPAEEREDDGWGGLSGVGEGVEVQEHAADALTILDKFKGGDPGQIVPEEELPYRRVRLTPDDDEEEDMDAVRKGKYLPFC